MDPSYFIFLHKFKLFVIYKFQPIFLHANLCFDFKKTRLRNEF